MTEVEKQTKSLAAAIRKSSEREQYTRAYAKLCMRPELLSRLNRFRRKYFLLLNTPESDERTQHILKLEQDFADVLSEGVVREFLAAQQRLCTMVRDIYRLLVDAVKFEMDFMFDSEEE